MVTAQHDRLKGAPWFPLLKEKDIIIIGQGGIGSWLSLMVARTGATLYTYDVDSFEEHNMSGQLVEESEIGENKAFSVKSIINRFSPTSEVVAHEYNYDDNCLTNDIMLCGVDSMEARKLAFERWEQQLINLTDTQKKGYFFQDGRLTADQLQIFNIPGDSPDRIQKYKEEYLFSSEEVIPVVCSFKQTSHCAAMIASHMTAFLTNWITNSARENKIMMVPFYYSYYVNANLTTII